ncbi:unnamed protein product [Linum trigynum]|uniref:Uncharacterized protein n=1 Tax=Linum trigynum TaxID=586398 RepID=A0AAV2GN67_9ROSI
MKAGRVETGTDEPGMGIRLLAALAALTNGEERRSTGPLWPPIRRLGGPSLSEEATSKRSTEIESPSMYEVELKAAAGPGWLLGWSPPGKERERKVEVGGGALFPFEPLRLLSFDETLLTFHVPTSGLGCVWLDRSLEWVGLVMGQDGWVAIIYGSELKSGLVLVSWSSPGLIRRSRQRKK